MKQTATFYYCPGTVLELTTLIFFEVRQRRPIAVGEGSCSLSSSREASPAMSTQSNFEDVNWPTLPPTLSCLGPYHLQGDYAQVNEVACPLSGTMS